MLDIAYTVWEQLRASTKSINFFFNVMGRYHSLHHTGQRSYFCLFMPFYDYLGGTVDPRTDSFYAELRKGMTKKKYYLNCCTAMVIFVTRYWPWNICWKCFVDSLMNPMDLGLWQEILKKSRSLCFWHIVLMCWRRCKYHLCSGLWQLIPPCATGSCGPSLYLVCPFCACFGVSMILSWLTSTTSTSSSAWPG
jgi:hypothetical protein